MRLDKYISGQGVCPRSGVRKMAADGRILVNGAVVKKVSDQVDPERDTITVDGAEVCFRNHLYLMLNKPEGVVSATEDRTHKTVLDLVPEELRRPGLFPAGRLDADTTGFVLLTDDGLFAHRILSPRSHVRKTYAAELAWPVTAATVRMLREGIVLRDGMETLPAEVEQTGECSLQIRIIEGKYHEVKRMCAAAGNRVTSLKRTAIGGLKLDPLLPAGACRELTREEQKQLEFGQIEKET